MAFSNPLASPPHRSGPPVPEVLLDGISEEALSELSTKYRPLLNKGLGERNLPVQI